MPTRLLIVALDSAEPLLVNEMVKKGQLPAIQALMEQGQTAAIENFPGFGNGVFWPSLNTGGDPSQHARYYRRQPKPVTYSLEPFHEEDFKLPPFWKALDDRGMRIAIIDPVESPGARPDNGIEILDWMSHGRVEPPRTSPPQLLNQIIAKYGDDPFDGSADMSVKKGLTPEEVIELSNKRIATKTRAMHDSLQERDWDLFYVTYGDAHDVGHMAWHLHETEQAYNPSSRDHGDSDPVEHSYQLLDTAIAKLMESVAPGGQTIVLMGPGIETDVTANPLLPDILRKFHGQTRSGIVDLLAKAIRAVVHSRFLPQSVYQSLKTSKARTGSKLQGMSGARYFAVPHNDNAGAVRINLAGREPHGVVSQDHEYDELCAELTERLQLIRDASGEIPLVSRIIKLHDHYKGPYLDLLPDLLVIWNREADVSKISSPEIGTLVNTSVNLRTGDHSTRGLVISSEPFTHTASSPLDPTQVTPLLVEAANRTAQTTSPH